MYFRKTRPSTTCLYSAASMLPRSALAAAHNSVSKPVPTPLSFATGAAAALRFSGFAAPSTASAGALRLPPRWVLGAGATVFALAPLRSNRATSSRLRPLASTPCRAHTPRKSPTLNSPSSASGVARRAPLRRACMALGTRLSTPSARSRRTSAVFKASRPIVSKMACLSFMPLFGWMPLLCRQTELRSAGRGQGAQAWRSPPRASRSRGSGSAPWRMKAPGAKARDS